jgi:1-phosphofructokinase family hexose kinase
MTIITVSLNPAIDRTLRVEGFTVGAHQKGVCVSRTAGGKALNVSRVLAAMGVASTAFGFLGDRNRQLFDELLAGERIEDRMLWMPGSTRENVTIADPVAHVDTHIREEGLEIDEDAKGKLRDQLAALAYPEATVVFSGSLPPGYSPEDQRELIDLVARAGGRAVVDTSGPALQAALSARLYLLCPNREELAEVTGESPAGVREVLQAVEKLPETVANVLCSLGSQGALLIGTEGAWHAKVALEAKEVVNTVGCGDTLLGAFLAASSLGLDVPRSLAMAVATASASALTQSAGDFDPLRRDALLAQTTCQRLERL